MSRVQYMIKYQNSKRKYIIKKNLFMPFKKTMQGSFIYILYNYYMYIVLDKNPPGVTKE